MNLEVSSKTFVIIIFGLFWFTAYFLIGNKFEINSVHAVTNGTSCEEKSIKIFKTKKPAFQNLNLERIERQIDSFFLYLDDQQYIKSYQFSNGVKAQFQQIFEMLASMLPIVYRETDSIHDVLKNLIHFYRILGKERITLINEVLKNESDILEPLMYTFYHWFNSINEFSSQELRRPSMEQLYVYACFFLETLGGRSYLFRRDSKVRILTTYYCVLIIDRANHEWINSTGLDIRPHLKLISEDIALQTGLNYKSQYSIKLKKLRKKYRLS